MSKEEMRKLINMCENVLKPDEDKENLKRQLETMRAQYSSEFSLLRDTMMKELDAVLAHPESTRNYGTQKEISARWTPKLEELSAKYKERKNELMAKIKRLEQ